MEILGKSYTVPRKNNSLAAFGETTINDKHCYCEGVERGYSQMQQSQLSISIVSFGML